MPTPLKVGLIGYGYAGRTFHAPLITATPGLQLAAIASSQADLVQADFPGMPVVRDQAALLANHPIDLVVLATPNASHYPLASAALHAGKHVVVDKPFTLTVQEAMALQAAASQANRLLSVFHNRRWDADFLLIQRLLADGQLGRITQFESRFDRFRPQVRQRWRESAEPGAGIWFDLGPHLIDQALQLFGMPHAVTADITARRDGALAADDAHVLLHYPELRVALSASCLVAGGAPRFLVHGTAGSLAINGLDGQETQLKQGLRPGQPGWGHDARLATLYREQDGQPIAATRPLPSGDYPAYYAGVRDALLGKAANPVNPGDAVAVMQVLDAALRSNAAQTRITLRE